MYSVDPVLVKELRAAAKSMYGIISRTVKVLQQASDETLLGLSLPLSLLPLLRAVPWDSRRILGRFDFAATLQGPKMLEFNADTPCLILEAYLANAAACSYFAVNDPNEGCLEDIEAFFAQSLVLAQGEGCATENVFFTAADFEEDRRTAECLRAWSGLSARGRFVLLKDLRIYDDGLYAVTGNSLEKVDVLYRMHPLENFALDKAADGDPTGLACLRLAAEKKLVLINPIPALLAQTKALQALIWGLYTADEFFTVPEREAIARYMLPTCLENCFAGKSRYVEKAVLGREGGAVAIFGPDGTLLAKDKLPYYWQQPKVYQKYVDVKSIRVTGSQGESTGKLIWGVFVAGGNPSAVTIRLSGNITDADAKFLPVGMSEERI
jgi:glutathionylspermidine synthase